MTSSSPGIAGMSSLDPKPSGGDFVPIGSPDGYTTEQAQNPFGDSGVLMTVAVINNDNGVAIAFAFQAEGDAFPRFLAFVNGFNSWYWGDGTTDPTLGTATITFDTDHLDLGSGTVLHDAILDGPVNISGILTAANDVIFPNLPVIDPAVAGQLWNNAGILTVSAG